MGIYKAWRASYSDPEQAARAAFDLAAERWSEQERLRELLERAATEADNACEGWNDALMHEGARKAGDAVRRLLVPNAIELRGGASAPSSD